MILFDITPGWTGTGMQSDKPRCATDTERNAYLRWLAEHRGVDISGCSFDAAGAYRGSGKDCVYALRMPGYGDTRRAIMETLDEAGDVIRTTTIATDAKGYMTLKAKQVQEACGLKATRKSKAAQKPSQRVQPEAALPDDDAAQAIPAPVPVAQPVQSAPHVDSTLIARVAALEAALARVGVAVLLSVPIAANDDTPAAKRTAAQERAIRRAWEMRRAMRERADLDRRALTIANGDNRLLQASLLQAESARDMLVMRSDEMRDRAFAAEARASDFERIAIAEASRADAADDRASAAIREARAAERLAYGAEERALNAHARASRIVGAAMRYRTASRRSAQDVRASRAEARALSRRLDDARRSIAASAPPVAPAGNSIAAAFADALN